MSKISTRIAVGIITFIMGVSAATVWYFLGRVSERRPAAAMPQGWRTVSIPPVTFSIPPDMTEKGAMRSIDTAVWGYESGDMLLTVESGRMGMPTRDGASLCIQGMSECREEMIEVGGEEATVLTFRQDDEQLDARGNGGRRLGTLLYVWGRNLNMKAMTTGEHGQEVAKQIFSTISFP